MEELLTPSQVSALLNIHVRTVYRLAAKGEIPGRRIGRTWRFIKSDILQLTSARDKKQFPVPVSSGNGTAAAESSGQLDKYVRELSALYAVAAAASESLELGSVLQEVIKKITEIFRFDCTRIFLFNREMDELHLRASFETHPEFFAQTRVFRRGQGNIGKVAETGEPIVFEDVLKDPRYQQLSHSKASLRLGHRFFAAFPIKSKLRTMGTILCIGREPRRLEADEMALITSMAAQIGIAVENASLLEEARAKAQQAAEKAKQLSALNSFAAAVAESLDLDVVLTKAIDRAMEILGFDAARAFLIDPERDELKMRFCKGLSGELAQPPPYRRGEGILGRVLESGAMIVFDDIQADNRYRELSRTGVALRQGFRSLVCLPIVAAGKVLGAINLFGRAPRRLQSDEIELLSSMGTHVAIAAQNAGLFEKVSRRSKELEILSGINRGIAGLLEQETLLARIAEGARELLKADGATFRLVEGESLRLVSFSRSGGLKFRPRLGLGESISGRVVREGRPIASRDVARDPRVIEEHRAMLLREGYHGYLGVPLRIGSRVIGAINVYCREEREFSPEEISLISAFADQAAIAVENSQLYEKTRKQALELEKELHERKAKEEEIRRLNEELEERVRRRTSELEAANKELEAFSYSVSHDLRAPLRAIDGFARILVENHAESLAAEAQRYLHLVRENAQQMGALIDDLLAFSRLGQQPLERKQVNPTEIATQALRDLIGENGGGRIKVIVGDLPSCRADPSMLRQVFMNLLSNALKFTRRRETPVIEIGCRQENGETLYFVSDNGVGFDMRYADKLFGVFQRLHRPEEYEGTGVGLAIVKRIIERHGGRVGAHATVDQGATFYFSLGGGKDD